MTESIHPNRAKHSRATLKKMDHSGVLLAYDGECPLCVSGVQIMKNFKFIPSDRFRAFQNLDKGTQEELLRAGFNYQMVAFDPDSEQTKKGIDGLLWVLAQVSDNLLVRILGLSPIKKSLAFVYPIIAYNRRILTPPARRVSCDCDPEPTVLHRLFLIAILMLFAVTITGLFGLSIAKETQLCSPLAGVMWMNGMAGSGWTILFIVSLFLDPILRLSYLGHLCVTMAVGVLVLLPSILLSFFIDASWIVAVYWGSIFVSFGFMLRMQMRRTRVLNLSFIWVVIWILSLGVGTASVFGLYFIFATST